MASKQTALIVAMAVVLLAALIVAPDLVISLSR